MGQLFPNGLGGVIFDCDGVIIDSRPANGVYYNRILAHFGLPPYFNPVVAADTPGILPKPSPQGPEHILAAWGLPPERALFVGDSSHDGRAAGGAGIPFASFGNEELAGDIVVMDYAALRAALTDSVEQQACS